MWVKRKIKLKITVYSLVILIIGSIGFLFVKEPSLLITDATNNPRKTVIIDAGHGGLTNTTDWV